MEYERACLVATLPVFNTKHFKVFDNLVNSELFFTCFVFTLISSKILCFLFVHCIYPF